MTLIVMGILAALLVVVAIALISDIGTQTRDSISSLNADYSG